MRLALRITGWLVVAAISGVLAVSGWLYFNYWRVPQQISADTTVVIDRGTRLPQMATLLSEKGIVDNPALFFAVAAVYSRQHPLKAGEYMFTTGMTPEQILEKMHRGEVVVHKITIAEGLTVKQIKAVMDKTEGLVGDFPDNIPEGSLLPNTYFYSLGEGRIDKVRQMQTAMRDYVMAEWEKRAPDLPLKSPKEAVILASIIEKETGVPEERPHIASVFINRLRKGMKLQTDPTIIYGLSGGTNDLGRNLTLSDLKSDTPYNTYVIDGLPPGAIANPGKAAIDAALHPMKSDDLFFVATGGGSHRFAATVSEHEKNVQLLREVQKQQAATQTTSSGKTTP